MDKELNALKRELAQKYIIMDSSSGIRLNKLSAVPNKILFNTRLKPMDKMVFAFVFTTSFNGKGPITDEMISKYTGYKARSISNAILDLMHHRYISTKRIAVADGHRARIASVPNMERWLK